MPVGTVKWFNEMKGFGFIQPDVGGADAFVHITAVERAGMQTLRENQRVAYDLQEDRPGKMSATNLRSADEAEQPQQSGSDAAPSDDTENSAE
jgi:CspA family cold shock protein